MIETQVRNSYLHWLYKRIKENCYQHKIIGLIGIGELCTHSSDSLWRNGRIKILKCNNKNRRVLLELRENFSTPHV